MLQICSVQRNKSHKYVTYSANNTLTNGQPGLVNMRGTFSKDPCDKKVNLIDGLFPQ